MKTNKDILRKFIAFEMREAEKFCNEHQDNKNHMYWATYGAFLQSKRFMDVMDILDNKERNRSSKLKHINIKYGMEF